MWSEKRKKATKQQDKVMWREKKSLCEQNHMKGVSPLQQ